PPQPGSQSQVPSGPSRGRGTGPGRPGLRAAPGAIASAPAPSSTAGLAGLAGAESAEPGDQDLHYQIRRAGAGAPQVLVRAGQQGDGPTDAVATESATLSERLPGHERGAGPKQGGGLGLGW